MGSRTRDYQDQLEDEFKGCEKITDKAETFDDILAELEAQILKYYLAKGYKVVDDQEENDAQWNFTIEISLDYKDKEMNVYFTENGNVSSAFYCRELSTKKMLDKAMYFFKVCETMNKPVSECGCPDCGSSIIGFPEGEDE
jgi:hypothetical protein